MTAAEPQGLAWPAPPECENLYLPAVAADPTRFRLVPFPVDARVVPDVMLCCAP